MTFKKWKRSVSMMLEDDGRTFPKYLEDEARQAFVTGVSPEDFFSDRLARDYDEERGSVDLKDLGLA